VLGTAPEGVSQYAELYWQLSALGEARARDWTGGGWILVRYEL